MTNYRIVLIMEFGTDKNLPEISYRGKDIDEASAVLDPIDFIMSGENDAQLNFVSVNLEKHPESLPDPC